MSVNSTPLDHTPKAACILALIRQSSFQRKVSVKRSEGAGLTPGKLQAKSPSLPDRS